MALLPWIRSTPFFLRFTWFTRILLAVAFLPTGTVKVMGKPFTTMSTDTPVGAFFDAMHQTGLYWRFLGAVQIAAAVLVLVPVVAHLGAAVFLGITSNLFMITVGVGFKGTPWITGFMLLACVYLAVWDYERFWAFLSPRPLPERLRPARLRLDVFERVGFAVFAGSLLGFFTLARGLGPGEWGRELVFLGVGAGLFTLVRFLTHGRKLRAAEG